VERYEDGNKVFFKVKSEAVLQHVNITIMDGEEKWETTELLPVADHKPIKLGKGIYEFCIQNEYNPYDKIFQQIAD
jgi:hypothetical protein